MQLDDIANAAFTTLLAVDGTVLRTAATKLDGDRFIANATPDEIAAAASVRFTDADGLLLGELPLRRASEA